MSAPMLDLIGQRAAEKICGWYASAKTFARITEPPRVEPITPTPVGIHQGRQILAVSQVVAAGRVLAMARAPRAGTGLDLALAYGGLSAPWAWSMWQWSFDYERSNGPWLNWQNKGGRHQPDMALVEWAECLGVPPPDRVRPGSLVTIYGRICAYADQREVDELEGRPLVLVDQWETRK